MSRCQFLLGDAFTHMATIPDHSVDLIVTSPPFLALRSYLPPGHPDKHKEIGSEATPAAFLSTLLALTREWRRVLAPHGSIAVELGDTYAGGGQGLAVYTDNRGNPDGMRDSTFSGGNTRTGGGPGWPLPKSLCLIPSLYAASLAYGHNLLAPDDTIDPWRIRNLVVWHRPNPPVGALGDKVRPATSYITTACVSDKRWFDLDAERGPGSPNTHARLAKGIDSRPTTGKKADNPNNNYGTMAEVETAGAPPLDCWLDGDVWTIPTQPYKGAHYATYPIALPRRLINLMCPREVCVDCARLVLPSSHDSTEMRGMRKPGREPMGDPVLFEGMCEPEHSPTTRIHQGMGPQLEGLHPDASTGSSNGEPRRLRHAAPVGGSASVRANAGTGGSSSPRQRDQGRQPPGELRSDVEVGPRPEATSSRVAHDSMPALRGADPSKKSCAYCGSRNLRRGLVLDPFCGSGTTLAAAAESGRDAIGIDLDERNLWLIRERVGLFLEEA